MVLRFIDVVMLLGAIPEFYK